MSGKKPNEKRISAESDNEEKKSSSRQINAYHKVGRKHCLAWIITDVGHFHAWRDGTTPLKSTFVLLPSGERPGLGTQVRCGTCGETRLNPTKMIYKQGGITLKQPEQSNKTQVGIR